jgi:protocatechuate 3,4-dioxygenase beta subunit
MRESYEAHLRALDCERYPDVAQASRDRIAHIDLQIKESGLSPSERRITTSISVSESDLALIDARAKSLGQSRTAYLVDVALADCARGDTMTARAHIERALALLPPE